MRFLVRHAAEMASLLIVYATLAIVLGALLMASYGPADARHRELLREADGKLDKIQKTLGESNDLIDQLGDK